MPEEKRISPGVAIAIVGGLLLAGGTAAVVAYALTREEEAPPTEPMVYTCPYCGAEFSTEDELLSHIETEHPGEILPTISFTLGIKNYPANSLYWYAYVNGQEVIGGLYPHEKGGITAPSVCTITIRIEEEVDGLRAIFQESAVGSFEDRHDYVFNCQTLKFEEVAIPVSVMSVDFPPSVAPAEEFWPSVKIKIYPTNSNIYSLGLYIPEDYLPGRVITDTHILRFRFIVPEYAGAYPDAIPMDSPDDIYEVRGTSSALGEGITDYNNPFPCYALYETWNVFWKAIPVGVYPVFARVGYNHVRGKTAYGPVGSYDLGQVGILNVDGAWFEAFNLSYPSQARSGELVTVSIDITNTGTKSGSVPVKLTTLLHGYDWIWDEKTVTVGVGQTETVSFSFNFPSPTRDEPKVTVRFTIKVGIGGCFGQFTEEISGGQVLMLCPRCHLYRYFEPLDSGYRCTWCGYLI